MAIVMKCAENQKLTTHVLDTYKIYDYIAQHHYSRRTLLSKGTVLKKIEVEDSTISEYVVTVDKDINLMVSVWFACNMFMVIVVVIVFLFN